MPFCAHAFELQPLNLCVCQINTRTKEEDISRGHKTRGWVGGWGKGHSIGNGIGGRGAERGREGDRNMKQLTPKTKLQSVILWFGREGQGVRGGGGGKKGGGADKGKEKG